MGKVAMPWKASSVMDERLRFVARLLEGEQMSLVCREFGISRKKAAGAHELRQDIELFAELLIEVTPSLVIGERLVPIGRRLERIPPNKNGARAFVVVETQQKIREPDACTSTIVTSAPDGFQDCVIGSMRKGIANDHEQRSTHDRLSTARSVGGCTG
jgi:hypothetical protein